MTDVEKRALLQNTLDTLKLTQRDLGHEIGVGQSHVSEMLSGARPIRKYHLVALESLLHHRGTKSLASTPQKPS